MNEANRNHNKSWEWKSSKIWARRSPTHKIKRWNFALVKGMTVRITKLALEHKLWNERYCMLDKFWADRCHVCYNQIQMSEHYVTMYSPYMHN